MDEEISYLRKIGEQVEANSEYLGALHQFLEKRKLEVEAECRAINELQRQMQINTSEIERMSKRLREVRAKLWSSEVVSS